MISLIRIMNHESCLAGRQVRIMIFVLFMILASLFMIHPVYAQANSTPAQQSTWEESKPTSQVSQSLTPIPFYVPPTSPLYTDLLVNNLFHSFSCLAIGQSVIGQPCLTYQVTKNAQGAIRSVPMLSSVNLSGGTLGAITGVIGALYQNPPVRTADYLASVGQSFGIAKEARAQVSGSGANVLSPILSLWQVSRNISYVIMILIFVIIGIMVMFRSKINPQTVISAQAAIPGLVIGLILITFSYFLAGLVSDMAFVGTNVVGYYFSAVNAGHVGAPQNLVKDISSKGVLSIFSQFVGTVNSGQTTSVLQQVYDSFSPAVQDTVGWFVSLLAFQFVAPLGGIAGPWGLIAGPAIGLIAGGITKSSPVQILGFFLQFVVVAVLIYAMIRLLLRLINSYLTIIFLTISAPFQFLFASLPGRQGIATGWIMSILANILVFPAVLAVFYFIAFLLGQNFPPFTEVSSINRMNNAFVPAVYAEDKVNIVGKPTFPLFGDMDIHFIQMLIAFGALIALPAIPDIIVKAVGKAGQAGQMIGQEISGNIRTGQGSYIQSVNRASGAADSIGKGYSGERSFYRKPGGGFDVVVQKPGVRHLFEGNKKATI